MIYKHRSKSDELLTLEILNKRTDLSSKDKQYLTNLQKGYEGEVLFDSYTEQLQCDCLIINDLLLELNNTTFQIDSLIFIEKMIHLYEVKNLEGDYFYESNKLFKKPKLEIVNPLLQMNRAESLLCQLLRNNGFQPQIEASVVFINPTFTLYQAPLNLPAIFPTQIQTYMHSLNRTPSKINEHHKRIADRLLSLHMTKSLYSKIPSYTFDMLRKGITCKMCDSFAVVIESRKCVCKECGHTELVSSAVLRAVKEFQILFPGEKITTNAIYEWCQVVSSKERIRYILANNFTLVGVHQWSHFV